MERDYGRFSGKLPSARISYMMSRQDDERLTSWKKSFAKIGIRYETDEEYEEAIHNLVGYFELLIEMDQQQRASQGKISTKTRD